VVAVFTGIVILALVPQLLFSVLYWKWIPAWIRNPYGRLAQLDSWSLILLLIFFLVILALGDHIGQTEKRVISAVLLLPFIFAGFLKLTLLKRAVDSSKDEPPQEKR
jgi:hypothetical protein